MHKRFLLLFVVLFSIVLPHETLAARLYISPASGSYKVGDTITAKVLVGADVSINAVSAHLSFTQSSLTIQSVSKASSILNFWVSEPAYSQSGGSVDMEGVSLSGFQGSTGNVLTMTFKAKRAGNASISFDTGQVLANDGQGTDVTSGTTGASYTISDATEPDQTPEPTPAPEPAPVKADSGGVVITSTTHPDQNTWYARTDGIFSWNIADGTTATRILLDTKKASQPTILYDGALISKNISDLSQGVSYLHVQLKDGSGWGVTGHFAIHVDTVAPVITQFEELARSDQTDPRVRVYAKATDATSGVDSYEFSIDGKAPQAFTDTAAGLYALTMPSGFHTLTLTAYDKAHNASSKSITVGVTPLPQPEITDIPAEVSSGQSYTVLGKGAAKTNVTLYFVEKRVTERSPLSTLFTDPNAAVFTLTGQVDGDGRFSVLDGQTPASGVYRVYAVLNDSRGAQSLPSEPRDFAVTRPGYLMIGELTISLLSIVAPLAALAATLVASTLWMIVSVRRFRRSLRAEVEDVDLVLGKAMLMLKDDIATRMKDLEKKTSSKDLRAAEERMLSTLEAELKDTEKYIRKEVRDVKKLLSMKREEQGPQVKIEVKKGK